MQYVVRAFELLANVKVNLGIGSFSLLTILLVPYALLFLNKFIGLIDHVSFNIGTGNSKTYHKNTSSRSKGSATPQKIDKEK